MTTTDSQVRVKVYELERGTNWVDKGTGFCTLEDYQGVLHLNVASEEGPSRLLLDCVVQRGEVYQQQEATLIVWTEPTGEDLALSFQESEGCMSILNQITEFENAMNDSALGDSFPHPDLVLPKPAMGSLKEIEAAIIEAGHSIYHRDKLVSFLVNNNYFDQLRELHETCEDLDATEELRHIFDIMQRIILLNDSSVLECIVRDGNILAVAGMLEYEPQHSVERGTYRDFLRDNSRFKQVVPIPDPAMEAKIHQTFRLQYLKDVVLPRILDEGTLTIINSLIFFNHIEIANYFQQNHAFLKDLFDILHESDDPERRRNVVLFVRQFCTIAKNLPINYRIGLYRTLSQHGLFTIFEFSLQDEDQSLRMSGADVLMTVLEQDRALVRSYVLAQISQQREGTTLLSLIIQGTRKDIGSPIQVQCCEMLRMILDTMPPPSESFGMQPDIGIGGQADRETDAFLRLFYEKYAFDAMEPLLCLTATDIVKIDVHDKRANMLLFLCDLLSFMVRQHSYQARYFVFSSGISKPISNMLSAKPKYLRLAALRFIRTCVGMCDELYNKQLVGQRLLDPIVELFVESSRRDNLITSACRELFKFIANHKIADLLSHFVTVHATALAKVPATLEHLKHAYEEYLEDVEQEKNGGTTTPTVKHSGRMSVSINMLAGREAESATESSGNDAGGLWKSNATDAVEEAYFDDIDDDAETAADTTKAKPARSPILSAPSNSNGAMGSGGDPEIDMADIGIRSPLSSKSPLIADTDHPDRSPLVAEVGSSKQSPLLAPRSPKPFRPRNLSSGSADSKDADADSVDSEAESSGESDGFHRISMSDAFPDSKLINRKMASKPLLRRSDSSIKIVMTSRPNSLVNGDANGVHKSPFGKRPHSSGGSNGTAPKKIGLANGTGHGLSKADKERPTAASEMAADGLAAATKLAAVTTCAQDSAPIGLVSKSAGPESPAPPKKAKTAST